METELHKALLDYDGKSTDFLVDTAAQFCDDPEYPKALTTLFGSHEKYISDGATWLFKHAVENGADISTQVREAFVQTTPKTHSWAAQLHVCQSVRYLPFTLKQAEVLVIWVRSVLDHKRPFLRAWSLDALVSLALQHEGLMAEAQTALQLGSKDGSASVRARTRQLAKLVL